MIKEVRCGEQHLGIAGSAPLLAKVNVNDGAIWIAAGRYAQGDIDKYAAKTGKSVRSRTRWTLHYLRLPERQMRLTCPRGHSYRLTSVDLVALAISESRHAAIYLGQNLRVKSQARDEAHKIALRLPKELELIEQKELDNWQERSGVGMAWYTLGQGFKRLERAVTKTPEPDDLYLGDKKAGWVTPKMVCRMIDQHLAFLNNSSSSETNEEPNFED